MASRKVKAKAETKTKRKEKALSLIIATTNLISAIVKLVEVTTKLLKAFF